jgi:hypothetical protein
MPRAEFEPITIPVFELSKTVRVLNSMATGARIIIIIIIVIVIIY